MLTSQQTENIRRQIIQQIEKSFPEDKKKFAKSQIEAMNSEQLEGFLNQNKLMKTPKMSQECVFCSIVSGSISSYKISENSKAAAVLEINPVSRGHSIIIPKEHVSTSEKVHQSVFSLAKKVSKMLKEKLKPKNVTTASSDLFGHEIINVIPVYENENQVSERKPATQEELTELQKILAKTARKTQGKTKKVKVVNSGGKIWLPKRIP